VNARGGVGGRGGLIDEGREAAAGSGGGSGGGTGDSSKRIDGGEARSNVASTWVDSISMSSALDDGGAGGSCERAHSGSGGGARRDGGGGGTDGMGDAGGLREVSTDEDDGAGTESEVLGAGTGTTTAGIPMSDVDARTRASRRLAARSTSAFERASSRVNRSESPGSPAYAFSLNPTTRPSPRSIESPFFSTISKRSTTPCGRDCAPRRITLVRVSVSNSRSRYSCSVAYGRVMRIATGVFCSSATTPSIRYRPTRQHGNRARMTDGRTSDATDRAIRARVLVVGGGAREHAIAWQLAREGCEVLVAPGNAGTSAVARNVAVRADDVTGIVELASQERVDLVVVGPELPLTLGVVDALQARSIAAFGPSREAARLEGSKAHMKRFCTRHGIPTAAYAVFDDADAAEAYVRAANRPLVVKADGLAAGKGVVVAADADEACAAVDRILRKRGLGDAGVTLVIEEVLPGEEASFHVVCDGTRFVALEAAQDHKRVFDGDRGPNTGGMGAYAPAPIVTPEVLEKVRTTIVEPTLAGMEKDGAPFRGVLFVGLMIEAGEPRVLEYNVRFGDPETSLFELLDGASRGDLRASIADLAAHPSPEEFALCVVMAAESYPATPRTGDAITGLDAALDEDAYVFHAGTALRDGAIVTAGGRVLAVGARARTLDDAALKAYRAVDAIHWRGEHHRRDIGHRARTRV